MIEVNHGLPDAKAPLAIRLAPGEHLLTRQPVPGVPLPRPDAAQRNSPRRCEASPPHSTDGGGRYRRLQDVKRDDGQ
jgi:hypothetical protein